MDYLLYVYRNPQFEFMVANTTILEESIPNECIFRVKAYDPDIGDRSVPQNISYFIYTGKDHFSVGPEDGCVKVIKPLDREEKPFYQLVVGAQDEWGLAPTKLDNYQDLIVNLIDINDNAVSFQEIVFLQHCEERNLTLTFISTAKTFIP